MDFNPSTTLQTGLTLLTAFGLKVVGALVLWFICRWLIRLAVNLIGRALDRQALDRTVIAYIRSGIGLLLNVVLIVALLGFFGVQTASFAALLAGIGIAVGMAWSGLLSISQLDYFYWCYVLSK